MKPNLSWLANRLSIYYRPLLTGVYKRNQSQIRALVRSELGRAKLAVDLGSGSRPRNSFKADRVVGIDLFEDSENSVICLDLSRDKLPFQDNTVDLITAYDFFEHIPRWERQASDGLVVFPFVNLMQEIFRSLRPGGILYSVTPVYPRPEVFQDPTHVNFISRATFGKYFCGSAWASIYGFSGSFLMLRERRVGGHLHTLMKKPDSAGTVVSPHD